MPSFAVPETSVMEVEMDARLFIAAIAAAGLVGLDAMFTATTVPIEGSYSRASLDEICAAAGGKGYGSAGKAYGCSKESTTVECRNDGSCKGYVYFRRESDIPATGDPLALLVPAIRNQVSEVRGEMLSDGRSDP
jgi:hypothetical protein